MDSKGVERHKQATPGQTPEGNVVMSFSFESYQLEEEDSQVKDISDKGVLALSEPAFEEPIPDDRYHGIYFAMLLAGVGFLLPYNSFITDVDYLHHKFEGTSIVFDMGLTYILVALVAVILNNVLMEMLSLHTRITVGYLFALGPLLFVTVFDVWLERFTTRQSYVINLMSMGTVAFGCTVQQSSFYGYMGMLPKRYTQGVMTGESTAGVIISLSRIFTKLLIKNERKNTIIFFTISICMVLLCFILHIVVRRTRFVQYYTGLARQGLSHTKNHSHNGTQYQVHHDVITEDVRFGNGAVGSSPTEDGCTDFAGGNTYVRFDVPKPKIKQSWPGIRVMILHRYAVARVIWTYMLSIAVTYFITLCLFPGLESEIRNVTLGEWLPILIMAIFNISDFVGKILAAVPYEWNGTRLLFCSCVRVVFIPLFIMCVYPAQKPTFSHPAWPCIFSLLMGITNGYFGSVPMIHAAGKVAPEQRELAGNIMTVSYMSGLMLGSVVAYAAYSFTASGSSLHSETGYNFTQGY
ncbi:equilibrative nucleoside transporter 4-like [Carassius gibelio]|uniref:equilibrative nucleoside transporter 4-like n=1 Tax=Carassius gibelio TaxID=101364 RepID=UPI0022785A8A|nr:equilibrative nucleoside transporter 4-like [Carassius gibelio]XP_052406128.1 equilibrative nucleoside transporter 4-like [Carassius gibelio]